MHPIINELKQQAMTVDTTFSESGFVSFDEDKFAKLIIKECATFLRLVLDNSFAAEQLVEHFEID